MSEMLKFCYLSLILMLLSCGAKEDKKNEIDQTAKEVKVQQEVKTAEKTILFFIKWF